MLYETCARAEELLQVNIEDLDLAGRCCPVKSKGAKPRTRRRSASHAEHVLGGWCRTGSFAREAKSVKTGTARTDAERLRRPADQITLPKIAIFGGGRLFAMQNTSHPGRLRLTPPRCVPA